MAYRGVVQATCPAGCEAFEAEVWSVIRGDLDQELKERLLAGEINLLSCPACSRVFYFEHTLLYLDPAREWMAFIYPEAYRAEEARWRKAMEEDHRKFQAALPEKERRPYAPALYFGVTAFIADLQREEQAREEWEVAAAVAQELGLALYQVKPSYAREKRLPGTLPLAPGSGPLRQRLLAGLRALVKTNDRLAQYARLLADAEKAGASWEAPPQAQADPLSLKRRGRG